MWPWLPAWILKTANLPVITPRLLAVQAAMLTGAFAMGGAAHSALVDSTYTAQAALNATAGEAGAIEAIRTVGMANIEARGTLRAEGQPDRPIEHAAVAAIMEAKASAERDDPAAVQARFVAKRQEVLRALLRSYHHERLQLEALQPQDAGQRELIAQRLRELDDLEDSTATILGGEPLLEPSQPEPADSPAVDSHPAVGIRQALSGSLAHAEPDTVASPTQPLAEPDTVSAAPVFAQADAPGLPIDAPLGD